MVPLGQRVSQSWGTSGPGAGTWTRRSPTQQAPDSRPTPMPHPAGVGGTRNCRPCSPLPGTEEPTGRGPALPWGSQPCSCCPTGWRAARAERGLARLGSPAAETSMRRVARSVRVSWGRGEISCEHFKAESGRAVRGACGIAAASSCVGATPGQSGEPGPSGETEAERVA